MTALFKLLARLPLAWLHALGWVAGWLSFLLSPIYRRRFVEHAALAGYRFAQVRAGVGQAGRMVMELPRLWFGVPPAYEWDGADCIARAFAAGRGIVFLTPHMGCFEIAPQAMAREYGPRHGPMTVLYRPARKPWLSELVDHARRRPGLETAPTTLAGVRQMVRALRAGRAVGLLPDQVPPLGQGVWARFFGREAYTMTLAVRLVQQTGAHMLVAWSERRPGGRGFLIHVREPLQALPADTAAAVAQINGEMEALIRQCPAQYLWGYARYKAPRVA